MTKEKRSMGASKVKSTASVKMNSSTAANGSTSASTCAAASGDDDGESEADDALMSSIKRSNDAFTSLLSLIPAQYYLAADSEDSSEIFDINSAIKNKRKQEKAQGSAERKVASKEAKRARLDPDNFRSAADVQKEKAAAKEANTCNLEMNLDLGVGSIDNSRAGDTDSEEGSDDDDDDDDDNGSAETQLTSVKGSDDAGEKPLTNGHQSGILDLRARLQAKIQSMQAQRKMIPSHSKSGETGDDAESVASTKDELLEERRRKRGEMRDKRRRAMKERRRAERAQAKESNSSGNSQKGSKAPILPVKDKSTPSSSSSSQGPGQSAPLSDLAFSSIKFGDDSNADKSKKNRHELPSDPKVALAILEARRKKEEDRAAKHKAGGIDRDDESDKGALDMDRKDRDRWSKAEAAAQGVKIRDDENLLKKAAKKKDKIKEKSRKEWNDRDRELKDQAAARQKKRNDNIAARKISSKKGASKGKKMGGGKKPKARAGFEGTSRHAKFNGKPKNKLNK